MLGEFPTQIVQLAVKSVQHSKIIVAEVTACWAALLLTAVAVLSIFQHHPYQLASAYLKLFALLHPHTASPTLSLALVLSALPDVLQV